MDSFWEDMTKSLGSVEGEVCVSAFDAVLEELGIEAEICASISGSINEQGDLEMDVGVSGEICAEEPLDGACLRGSFELEDVLGAESEVEEPDDNAEAANVALHSSEDDTGDPGLVSEGEVNYTETSGDNACFPEDEAHNDSAGNGEACYPDDEELDFNTVDEDVDDGSDADGGD